MTVHRPIQTHEPTTRNGLTASDSWAARVPPVRRPEAAVGRQGREAELAVSRKRLRCSKDCLTCPWYDLKAGVWRWNRDGFRKDVDPPADIVFFTARRDDSQLQSLGGALSRFDLLITGPHATAAIPAELQPFCDPRLSYREQYDFSDISGFNPRDWPPFGCYR